jgi:hypothetical protein
MRQRKRRRKTRGYQPKPLLPEERAFHEDVHVVCHRHFQTVLAETFDTVAFVTDITEVMRQHMVRIAMDVIETVLAEEWHEYRLLLDDQQLWRDAFLERFNAYLVPYLEEYQAKLAEQNAHLIVEFAHLPTRAEYLCGMERIQNIAITETTWTLSRAQEAVSSVYNDVMHEVRGWLESSSGQFSKTWRDGRGLSLVT